MFVSDSSIIGGTNVDRLDVNFPAAPFRQGFSRGGLDFRQLHVDSGSGVVERGSLQNDRLIRI